MILAVPYFGNDGRYRAMLDRWIEAYASSGCQLQFVIVSDYSEPLQNVPWLRVDTSPFAALVRDGNAMDRKGVIVLSALQVLGSCLVLDADALFQQDPTRFLDAWTSAKHIQQAMIAMPQDMSGRMLRLPWATEEFPECCAGVMYFGDASRQARMNLTIAYAHAFTALAEAFPEEHLIEQRAWSLVNYRTGGPFMPDELNWSPQHRGPNPKAYILHHHGPAKWAHNP